MTIYKIAQYDSTTEFLSHIARKSGKLSKGGIPNYEAVARGVLKDWGVGKIPFFTTPPENSHVLHDLKIVSEWGKAFCVDDVMESEQSLFRDIGAGMDRDWMSMGVSNLTHNGDISFVNELQLNDTNQTSSTAPEDKMAEDIPNEEKSEDNSTVTLKKRKRKSVESSLNVQRNLEIKKNIKLKAKKKRKQDRSESTPGIFNFSTDFVADNEMEEEEGGSKIAENDDSLFTVDDYILPTK